MTTISKSYIHALLADATYKNVTPSMNRDDVVGILSERMTPTLAKFIADTFEVHSAIDTPDAIGAGSGFDATVWKGRAGTPFEGQVFVSTRGTEPKAGGQDFLANVDLALNDAARAQIVDMVNWWLRETASEGASANAQLDKLFGGSGRMRHGHSGKGRGRHKTATYSRAAGACWISARGKFNQKPHHTRATA